MCAQVIKLILLRGVLVCEVKVYVAIFCKEMKEYGAVGSALTEDSLTSSDISTYALCTENPTIKIANHWSDVTNICHLGIRILVTAF